MSIGREKDIFLSAIDLETGQRREAYLVAACGADPALRRAVDALLAAHDRTLGVLDAPPEACERALVPLRSAAERMGDSLALDPRADRTGEVIGHYRLMEKLGEGGFGEVYVAEQSQPIRRRVALKLLKPGMDSREVCARFDAERQALALMDHPNIATVFDAGTTPTGQPYFVMELVRGVPITEFCDQSRMTIRARIELFVDVCLAVQHAHQKGVIHRDLKPSNVMVTLHDASPVVKVIDFGVAKAIGEPLTQMTIYTRFAQMIGTPMYMSPEQAEMNSLDVDTRSDVYALGVLLYELLTGTTPFDQQRLRTASFDELRRMIREEEPPRPSVRLSTLSLRAGARSNRAAASGPSLAPLRRELDWIVMKALEKDRRRRYDTAADVARDVRRYLDHLPVAARPPSPWYRFQKLAQRNKVVFTTSALVLTALIVGTVVSADQAIRATRALAETDRLRNEAVEFADRLKEANVLLDSARANADEGRWSLAWSQYSRATVLQPDHYLTWSGRASLLARLGAWRAAAPDFARALELGAPANNPAWWGVPQVLLYADDARGYAKVCDTLRRQIEQTEDSAMIAMVARSLALRPSRPEPFADLARRLEPIVRTGPPFEPPGAQGRPPMGFPAPPLRDGPREHGRPRGGEPPRSGWIPAELYAYSAGLAHFRAGNPRRAVEHLRTVAASGPRFPAAGLALPVLALCHQALDRSDDAERTLRDAGACLDGWITAYREGGPTRMPVPWFDMLEGILLYHEAHTRIRGAGPVRDDRLRQLEDAALEQLSGL